MSSLINVSVSSRLCAAAALVLLAGTAAVAQTTIRVSVDTVGAQSNGNSTNPAISPTGQHIAFVTAATNLWSLEGNESSASDVYIHYRSNGHTDRASWTGSFDNVSNQALGFFGPSTMPAIALVNGFPALVFTSTSDQAVGGQFCPENNGHTDLYRGANGANLFSTFNDPNSSCPGQTNGDSTQPAWASGGSVCAFTSLATNLVTGDTNNVADIYLRNPTTTVVNRVSGGRIGGLSVQANGASGAPSCSADGLSIAYESDASNIIVGDTNSVKDIFITNRGIVNILANFTTRVSIATDGTQANSSSFNPSISDDGNVVVFESAATNLVSGDSNGFRDIFVRDRVAGTTVRISTGVDGPQSNGPSFNAVISGNGRFVAFASDASNLTLGDSNAARDVFLFDRTTGVTRRVSVSTAGAVATGGGSDHPSISQDGLTIAFDSAATNLVAGDTNDKTDIFVRNIALPPQNDTCSGATVVDLGITSGSNVGASTEATASCATSSNDVWYAFTPPLSTSYKLEVISGLLDTVVSVYSDCPASAANQIVCDDDSGAGTFSRTVFDGAAGTTYFIRIAGFAGLSGAFQFRLSAANDLPADAHSFLFVNGANLSRAGVTTGSAADGTSTCPGNTSPDIYYFMESVPAVTYRISVTGNFDTVLSVHSGIPATAANQLACNDDFGALGHSEVLVPFTAGLHAVIRVAGFTSTQAGLTNLVITPVATCAPDFNHDGTLDPDDLADFIGAFFSQPPLAGADYNGDGIVDPDDLADYIGAFFNGC